MGPCGEGGPVKSADGPGGHERGHGTMEPWGGKGGGGGEGGEASMHIGFRGVKLWEAWGREGWSHEAMGAMGRTMEPWSAMGRRERRGRESQR